MRGLACVFVVITLLVGAFFGYVYYGTQMQVVGVAASMVPAVEVEATYDDIVRKLDNGSFLGEIYAETEFLMPDSYAFLTLTVRMQNRGMFPMDYIQFSVKPDSADIVQLPADRTPSLAGNSVADFSTTLLTRTGADTSREIAITYYVLGRQFTVTYTPGT